MSLYVYAVLDTVPPRSGQAPRLRFVSCGGGLVAAVRTVRSAPAPSAASLRRHDRVVRTLAEAVPAIVPARFGSLVDGEAALGRLLRGRRRQIRAALALVRGRVQMTLRVWSDAARTPAPPVPFAGRGAGKRYLSARASWWRGADVPGLEQMLDALRPLTAAERMERHSTPPLVASVYHLVERGRLTAYRRALRRPHGRIRVRVSGPWPPYAFAPQVAG